MQTASNSASVASASAGGAAKSVKKSVTAKWVSKQFGELSEKAEQQYQHEFSIAPAGAKFIDIHGVPVISLVNVPIDQEKFRQTPTAPKCELKAKKWSYVFYITNDLYARNVVVNVRRLYALGKNPDIDITVVLTNGVSEHLRRALVYSGVTCFIEKPTINTAGDPTWGESNVKLFVLGLDQFERVLYYDSDGIFVHLPDHLFDLELNSTFPLRMPTNYWDTDPTTPYASFMFLVKPMKELEEACMVRYRERRVSDFDMRIINQVLKDRTAMIEPVEGPLVAFIDEEIFERHPRFKAPFRDRPPKVIMEDTSYIHFSVSPKPWLFQQRDYDLFRNERPKGPGLIHIFETFNAEWRALG